MSKNKLTDFEGIAADVKNACDAVKAKRDNVHRLLHELKDKRENQTFARMEDSNADPFDPAEIERIVKTGSPYDEKQYVALSKAAAASVFRDSEFYERINSIFAKGYRGLVETDQMLEREFWDSIAEAEKAVSEANRKVDAARAKLDGYRLRVTSEIVKPIIDADFYRLNETPYECLGDLSSRCGYVSMGRGASVQEQINTLMTCANVSRLPIKNAPRLHSEPVVLKPDNTNTR